MPACGADDPIPVQIIQMRRAQNHIDNTITFLEDYVEGWRAASEIKHERARRWRGLSSTSGRRERRFRDSFETAVVDDNIKSFAGTVSTTLWHSGLPR